MISRDPFELYKRCTLCPRKCEVDRNMKAGFCGEKAILSIDCFLLHHGEEPCISHKNGSGTIFFTGCALRCPFCQNKQISQNAKQKTYYSFEQFLNIIKYLIKNKAENINFVTPDHFMPHILKASILLEKEREITPFVYNCSGYETIEHLELIVDYVDIFLIDYKFADEEASSYCIGNRDYPVIVEKAIDFVIKKKGNLVVDTEGKALKGVLIRHLVMPDFIENSIKVINNLYFGYGKEVYISLMSQYSPFYLDAGKYPKIARKLRKDEYMKVVELVEKLGFNNGYIQDYINFNDGYIPDFDTDYIFEAQKEKDGKENIGF